MNNQILPLLAMAASAMHTPFNPFKELRYGSAEFHPRISQRQKRKAARRSGKFPVRK